MSDTGRIGTIFSVEGGYILRDPADDERAGMFHIPHQAVVVHGDQGRVLFIGFGWGYAGEGARGLAALLKYLGMAETAAREFAHDDQHFPKRPELSEFDGKPGFITYWQTSIPDWTAVRLRRDQAS